MVVEDTTLFGYNSLIGGYDNYVFIQDAHRINIDTLQPEQLPYSYTNTGVFTLGYVNGTIPYGIAGAGSYPKYWDGNQWVALCWIETDYIIGAYRSDGALIFFGTSSWSGEWIWIDGVLTTFNMALAPTKVAHGDLVNDQFVFLIGYDQIHIVDINNDPTTWDTNFTSLPNAYVQALDIYVDNDHPNGVIGTIVQGGDIMEYEIGISTDWELILNTSMGGANASFTWLRGSNTVYGEFAISATNNPSPHITFFRAQYPASIVSGSFDPDPILVNPGVASESTTLTVVANDATSVTADLSPIGGSVVSLTSNGDNVWIYEDISSTNPAQTYQIEVIATNDYGSDSLDVALELVENTPPVWDNSVSNLDWIEDIQGSYTLQASDPNQGQNVIIDWTSLPAFVSESGFQISGTADDSEVGTHNVSAVLTDDLQDETQVSFTITVENVLPVISGNFPTEVMTGETVSVDVTSDEGTLSAVYLPDDATFTNGTFSWTVPWDAADEDSVHIICEDLNGGVAHLEHTFTITDNNSDPVIDEVNVDQYGFVSRVFTGIVTAHDPNGHDLYYDIDSSLGNNWTIDDSGNITGNLTVTGDDEVTVTVEDNFGGVADSTFTVTVLDSHFPLVDESLAEYTEVPADSVNVDLVWFISFEMDSWASSFNFEVESTPGAGTESVNAEIEDGFLNIEMVMEESGTAPNGVITFTRDNEAWAETGTILLLVPYQETLLIVVNLNSEPYSVGDVVFSRIIMSNSGVASIQNQDGLVLDEIVVMESGIHTFEHTITEDWLGRETEDFIQSISLDDSNLTLELYFSVYTTEIDSNIIPTVFSANIYPNPFNPSATLDYSLPQNSAVDFCIYNIRGQIVRNNHYPIIKAGIHSLKIDAANWPSGVYFYSLKSEYSKIDGRFVLLK